MKLQAPSHINTLTGVRAFAAVYVAISHLFLPFLKGSIFYSFFLKNSEGVYLFFMLSGFILCHVYKERFKKGNLKTNLGEFFFNRFARIYPLHILCLLYVALFCIVSCSPSSDHNLAAFLQNVFLIQAWGIFGLSDFSYNFAAWSISVEMFCYLLFPFFILFLNRINKKWLWVIFLCFCFLSYKEANGQKFLLSYFKTIIQPFCWGNPGPFYCGYHISIFGMPFFIGVVLFYVVENLYAKKYWDYGFLISLLFLITFLFIPSNQIKGWLLYVHNFRWLAYALLLVSLYKTRGIFQKIFGNSVIVYLGEISFSLYLTHQWVYYTLKYFHLSKRIMLISLPLSILLVSAALYHFVEKPSRDFLRRQYFKWVSEKKIIPTDGQSVSSGINAQVQM